jgi:hypothetical protein
MSRWVVVATLLAMACHRKPSASLRGTYTASGDGRSYLVIEGAPACPLELDGKAWSGKAKAPIPMAPGIHVLGCAGTKPGAELEIRAGQTFRFDYWGP